MSLQPGQQLLQYRLIEKIGEGGGPLYQETAWRAWGAMQSTLLMRRQKVAAREGDLAWHGALRERRFTGSSRRF